MESAKKTLELLAYFSTATPEIGLSQLCRLAGRDKATTYRHLQALEDAGFVEQNPLSKRYRLGPMILQLAQTREATVPRNTGAQAPLRALADATGETSHVTVLSGNTVYGLSACESPQHSTRTIVDIATFPLHATASGLCALAFGPDELWEFAKSNLREFTDKTAVTLAELENAVTITRDQGFGRAVRSFEDEVSGMAAPLFDQTGQFAGSVAVASVATRFDSELERTVRQNLIIASRAITHNWGGSVPQNIEALWAQTSSNSNALENAS